MYDISELLGVTLISITPAKKGDNEIIFEATDGKKWKMYHDQDYSEAVYIEDICGDLNCLIGSPIRMAEKSTNIDEFTYFVLMGHKAEDSFTWTFYRFATVKGYVTIRWLGVSNGYYSEEVDFKRF